MAPHGAGWWLSTGLCVTRHQEVEHVTTLVQRVTERRGNPRIVGGLATNMGRIPDCLAHAVTLCLFSLGLLPLFALTERAGEH